MKPPTVDRLETMIIDAMRAGDWAAVAGLEESLDRIDQPKPVVSMVSAALYYASIGLRVFPLQLGKKVPHPGTRGCKDASNDPEQILTWWQKWVGSNVAIATGHLVDVIDIDGPEGVNSWADITDMPDVIGTVSTPRAGGTHLYIKTLGLKNGAKIDPGIDIRGEGGYVVAPPSINTEGVSYRWRHPLDFNRIVPPLTGPVHTDDLCRQCGHPLNVEPHPRHYLAG